MKLLANVFRIVLGIVFVFSGFVKLVDPLGVQYKFVDYFLAMGLDFLQPSALFFGILMPVLEFLIGVLLLFNLKPKLGALGVLLFMSIFFPLTLWVAITNPVHDCGCFGDAIILSNWMTFWKSAVLIVMAIIVFTYRNKFKPMLPEALQWLSAVLVVGVAVWLSFFSIKHLPIIDFRPYRIGENITEGMEIPESERNNVSEYKTTLIYKNTETDETQEFDLSDIPEGDEWQWLETKNKLIKEGYVPPIHDFSISSMPISGNTRAKDIENEHVQFDSESLYEIDFQFENNGETETFFIDNLPTGDWVYAGLISDKNILAENIILTYEQNGETSEYTLFDIPDETWTFVEANYFNDTDFGVEENNMAEDITDLVLSDKGYSFLLVSYDIAKASMVNKEKINQLYDFATGNNIAFYCLTASSEEDVLKYIEKTGAMYSFYNVDAITLKTIVRSNPGLVLMKEGTILNKWSISDVPDVENFNRQLMGMSIERQVKKTNCYLSWMLGFALMLFFTLLFLVVKHLRRKRIIR